MRPPCTGRTSARRAGQAVQTQLLGILTARPLGELRGAQGLRLDCDELFASDEPIVAKVLPDAALLDLVATFTDLATGQPIAAPTPLRRDSDDIFTLEHPPLPPGDYRLRVEGVGTSAGIADPVHGLLSVVGDLEPGG